ncbi:MAG TPA: hypothetical protein VJC14_02810 [Candidatus Paceibacterota bacterium]
MNTKEQNKNCQNCKQNFTVEPEDFNFYEKIKVPAPTWCPECRFQRRMSWRNDWHLFRKKDARTGEEIFSFLPEESPVKIYDRDYWISDAWDPTRFGRDFDFTRPFFEQFKELLYEVPLPSHSMINISNCKYCTNATGIKNCYLVRGAGYTEDSAYLIWDQYSKLCFDSHMTSRCELSYGNVNTSNCYKTFFSVDCESCQEMILSKDCVACNSCIASIGLRNKSYCIFNKQYTKEEYQKKIIELNLGSNESFQSLKAEAYKHWLKYPQKFMYGRQNVAVSGDYIFESKNAKHCYRIRGVEDSKFVQNILIGPVRDTYDVSNYGENIELSYECLVAGIGVSNVKFSFQTYPNVRNLTYCIFSSNALDLFGCIGLKKKQYCILNKQYSKEEYKRLVSKIIEHMKKNGEYGEFFPSSLSPFPYEVTAANEFFPLTEEEAKARGFLWYNIERQNYKITLNPEDIPDDIKNIDKEILGEVIGCADRESCEHECTGAFRVIEAELDFCKRMNIPLPRLCTNCRHYERLSLRNSPSFYHRACMCDKNHTHHEGKCEAEFETSYAPDRPEIVYCEKCYQQEIY